MNLTYKGIWFLPNNKSFFDGLLSIDVSKTLQGTLIITEEGDYTLETLGNFSDVPMDETFTINGNSTDGMAITLFGCYDIKGSFNSNALINPNKYKAMQVVVTKNQSQNAYFDSVNDVKLSSFRFNSDNLNGWLFNSNFIYEGFQKYRAGKHIYVKYRLPKRDSGVKLKSGLKIKLITEPTISGLSIAETQRSITEDNFIELSRKDLMINDVLSAMDKILDFLTIAVGETQSPKAVSFVSNKIRYKYYFTTVKKGKEKKIIPQHMFFSYRFIEPQWNDIIKRWFDTYEEMIDIFRLFFSLFSNRNMYLNQRFLLLVQFLESFHRKTNPIDDEKINEWNIKLETAFSEGLNEKQIKDFKGKLKYGYEPPLEARLNALFKSSVVTKNFLGVEKYSVFSNKVAETRNYLTHLGHKTLNVIVDNKELIQACIKLDKLSRYVILETLGLTEKQMSEIIKKFNRLDMKTISM